MNYEAQRIWSDAFMPAVKRIVGYYLLEEAPFAIDANEATDLIILDGRSKKIAVRMRKHGYAYKWGHEFTIRAQLPSGAKTELSKIVDGFGDWMFYGHASKDGVSVERWMLIDLSAWRAALIRQKIPHKIKQNECDGIKFVAYDIRDLPENCLIASSFVVERKVAA